MRIVGLIDRLPPRRSKWRKMNKVKKNPKWRLNNKVHAGLQNKIKCLAWLGSSTSTKQRIKLAKQNLNNKKNYWSLQKSLDRWIGLLKLQRWKLTMACKVHLQTQLVILPSRLSSIRPWELAIIGVLTSFSTDKFNNRNRYILLC